MNIDKYQNTKPILTPRFIPCCTDELMEELRCVTMEAVERSTRKRMRDYTAVKTAGWKKGGDSAQVCAYTGKTGRKLIAFYVLYGSLVSGFVHLNAGDFTTGILGAK